MKTIFIGPGGIRAGWRLLIFFAIVVAEAAIIGVIAHAVNPKFGNVRVKMMTPGVTAGFEVFTLVITLGAAYVMSKIERRPFGIYGMPWRSAFGGRFWRGVLVGFVAISGVLGAIAAFRGFSISGLAVNGSQLAVALIVWTLAFVVVGLSEEFVFRGYTQFTLTTGIGFWPAAILLSCGFAAAHTGNPGESPMGLFQVILFGLVFCFVLLRTGNLWWGIGFHASWDWGETFFYGVPDSGLRPWHPLFATHFSGPVWLTGGSTGPEASVFTIVALLLTALYVAFAYPRVRYETPPGYSTGAASTT